MIIYHVYVMYRSGLLLSNSWERITYFYKANIRAVYMTQCMTCMSLV